MTKQGPPDRSRASVAFCSLLFLVWGPWKSQFLAAPNPARHSEGQAHVLPPLWSPHHRSCWKMKTTCWWLIVILELKFNSSCSNSWFDQIQIETMNLCIKFYLINIFLLARPQYSRNFCWLWVMVASIKTDYNFLSMLKSATCLLRMYNMQVNDKSIFIA